jgi:hypothetical protein
MTAPDLTSLIPQLKALDACRGPRHQEVVGAMQLIIDGLSHTASPEDPRSGPLKWGDGDRFVVMVQRLRMLDTMPTSVLPAERRRQALLAMYLLIDGLMQQMFGRGESA